jgi:hypothetical protein
MEMIRNNRIKLLVALLKQFGSCFIFLDIAT